MVVRPALHIWHSTFFHLLSSLPFSLTIPTLPTLHHFPTFFCNIGLQTCKSPGLNTTPCDMCTLPSPLHSSRSTLPVPHALHLRRRDCPVQLHCRPTTCLIPTKHLTSCSKSYSLCSELACQDPPTTPVASNILMSTPNRLHSLLRHSPRTMGCDITPRTPGLPLPATLCQTVTV